MGRGVCGWTRVSLSRPFSAVYQCPARLALAESSLKYAKAALLEAEEKVKNLASHPRTAAFLPPHLAERWMAIEVGGGMDASCHLLPPPPCSLSLCTTGASTADLRSSPSRKRQGGLALTAMWGEEVRLTGGAVRVRQTSTGLSHLKGLLDPHLARAHTGAMQARVRAEEVWREQYKVPRLTLPHPTRVERRTTVGVRAADLCPAL